MGTLVARIGDRQRQALEIGAFIQERRRTLDQIAPAVGGGCVVSENNEGDAWRSQAYRAQHLQPATTLEDAEICAIPYVHLTELSANSTDMQRVMARLMSREIVREHSLMILLGSMNAEERLAAFLINLSQRLKARGYSPHEFHLRMSRAEIGSYLGMKLETVSRTFSVFAQQRLLAVDKRHIQIIDLDRLGRIFQTHVH